MKRLVESRVAVLGLGTMGKALVSGLFEAELLTPAAVRATVRHPESVERVSELGVEVGTDNAAAAREADVLLLCVKPAGVTRLVEELASATRALGPGSGVASHA